MRHIGYLHFNSTSSARRVQKAFFIQFYLLKVSKLMNKYLALNKVFNYFDIGDAKNLVKLKEK